MLSPMRVVWVVVFGLAAWKWSKWRNWREYYSTILFMYTVSLASTVVTTNHKLWIFLPGYFLATHIIADLFITFLFYPSSILLYLSNYPQQKMYQVFYILGWVAIWTGVEYVEMLCNLVTYDNGWSLKWSMVFDAVMFIILRVHYKDQLLAWGLAGTFFIFIWFHFGFSIDMLK